MSPTMKKSKKRVLWHMGLQDQNHTIELEHSLVSGKKKVRRGSRPAPYRR